MSHFLPAAKRYKRAGSMIRTNLPTVATSYQFQPRDRGVVIGAAGITVTFPPYQDSMQGEDYIVANHSGGSASIMAPVNTDGTQGHIKSPADGSLHASLAIPAGESYTCTIETDTLCWIIT